MTPDPTICDTCGMALFSPAACYGSPTGPAFCLLCWLERAEQMREVDAIEREADADWIQSQRLRLMLPLEGLP